MTGGFHEYECPAGAGRDVGIAGLLAAAAVLGLSLLSVRGLAVEPEAAVVMIAERHDEEAARGVIRAVRAQLSDVSVALRVSWTDSLGPDLPAQIEAAESLARDPDTVAVFWCDLDRADRIYLYFAAPRGGRVLVRELEGSGPGGLAEALSIIVRTSVEAVLAGGRIGDVVPPAPPPRAAADEGRPPESGAVPSGDRVALSAAYRFDMLLAGAAGHAAALALVARLGPHFALSAGYAATSPLEAEAREVLLRLGRHPAWLGCRGIWGGRRLELAATVDFQVDFQTEDVRTLAEGLTVEDGELEIRPSLVLGLRLDILAFGRAALFVAAGADVALHRTRYLVGTREGPVEILSTWPVSPRAEIGAEVTLW